MNYEQFINYLKKSPFEGHQEQCGTGINYWNADYWTIEVASFLLYGDDYKIPEKFIDNRNCDPNRIKKDGGEKLAQKKILEEIKNEADVLLIGEVGRGLDILIANQVKKWEKIYCWDHVNYSKYLHIFDSNIEFLHKPSSLMINYPIQEKHIFIINHSLYSPDKFNSETNVHSIKNGELLW